MGHDRTGTTRVLDAAGNRVQTVQLQSSTGDLLGTAASPLTVDQISIRELLTEIRDAADRTNAYLAEMVGDTF